MFLVSSEKQYLTPYFQKRAGEQRLGEVIKTVESMTDGDLVTTLKMLKADGVKYILLGVPEDIGPRANLGKAGADKGWKAFLAKFCALQQNDFIRGEQIAVLGHVYCEDLQKESEHLHTSSEKQLGAMRNLVSELDHRVSQVCQVIFAEQLIPIVIGGGHNNAYPIIKAASQSRHAPISAINLDPHTDFRAPEGRHSGNGFSYAAKQGLLNRYFSLGMHELKNSKANIQALHDFGFKWVSYQDIWVRRNQDFRSALQAGQEYLNEVEQAIGIEVDVDSISFVPASAYTNCGISVQDAEYFVYSMGLEPESCYLHLAEGAPVQHPSGIEAGMNDIGQLYASLVVSFIQAKQRGNNE
ncbi:formimidoylglutamase [Thalassotalea hakodatensis]|uniref:formimidoylglutamase n=1 Tax=Thalassotalea hakodatensis TaxID=3030492 RepID=UPI0025740788|nr:formimidoylglutamase [Thalassotalea hakodatensis]